METKNSKSKTDLTKLQGKMAVASFSVGVVIACICLFLVPPPGEISTSALSLVSELFILAGAMLGVKVSVDAKLQRFRSEVENKLGEPENEG